MKVLALYNLKGGVGKTTAAVNLAYFSAAAGYRTLVWDLDPQGAATFCFRIKPKVKGGSRRLFLTGRPLARAIKGTDFDNLELLPADFSYRNLDLLLKRGSGSKRRLRRLLAGVEADYDVLIIDCAPAISLVSENVFNAVHALLIPVIPTPLSVRAFAQVQRFCVKHGLSDVQLLPFFSLVDYRRRLHRETMDAFRVAYPETLRAVVPYESRVELMAVRRLPLSCYARHCKAAAAFKDLWEEVSARMMAVDRPTDTGRGPQPFKP